MSPAPRNQRRHDEAATWATVGAVFVIVGLLWALGAVVQGQVQRANARPAQPARLSELSAECAPGGLVPCKAAQPALIGAPADAATTKPLPAAYR
jgi:hypothetical protein